MSKADTKYSEKERLVMLKNLDTMGLNPFAAMKMIESYIQYIHPLPLKYIWETAAPDHMDAAAESKHVVELYIQTAGYHGKRKGEPKKFDLLAAKLFLTSYYKNLRPLPVSFQVMNAVEVHVRTPGISDSDKKKKNPLRKIFNPTA